ncbi:MAG: ABC transporter ATP-binding protein [Bacteroidales bacterium]|nr:ABC transporter ATP-binding protein [Bacteroidales bacterium]
MESTVVINGLTIGYGKKVVANNINASIQKGELTCLLGANGVGKSTLLKTLSGFLGKLDGNISIMGKEMDTYSPKELSTTLGVVLTDKCEVRNMSVREIVGMGRSPYTSFWGALSKEDYKIVDQAIEMIGITHLSGRMVHTLSDGERQKAMIAKSLAQQTPIIILDEPTAFLDFPSKVEIMQLLHKLTREAGKTIFLSTHDMELALQIADKIWIMDKTCGFAIGTPEDLAISGDLEAFFIRKGIAFDPNSGLFKVENGLHKTICLQGKHGIRHNMVKKALHRNGIGTIKAPTDETDITVTIGAEGELPFSVSCRGEIFTPANIEELLKVVIY